MLLFPICFAIAQAQSAGHLEVPLENRKVAYFMRSTWPSVIRGHDIDPKAPSIKVSTNEAKNAIELDGPISYIESIRDVVRVFDIKPKAITVQLHCESVEDGLTFSSEATIENNTTWDCTWDAMQESTSIKARVNDDGTITLLIDLDYKGRKESTCFRIKHDIDTKLDPAQTNFKGFSFSVRAKITE